MKHHRVVRRTLAIGLMLTGGMIMLLSASTRVGLITLVVGIAIELVGQTFDRRYRS